MPTDSEIQIRLLTEIARWTKITALPIARDRVESLLNTEPKKRVYQSLEDGTLTVRKIEVVTGVNHGDIQKYLQEWESQGVVDTSDEYPRAVFTLKELGITAPGARESKIRGSTK